MNNAFPAQKRTRVLSLLFSFPDPVAEPEWLFRLVGQSMMQKPHFVDQIDTCLYLNQTQ